MKNRKIPDKLPAEIFRGLAEFIERECGIVLGEEKATHVSAAVLERMRACGATDPWEYLLGVMQGSPASGERKRLIAGLVVGETSFFRNPEQFRAFQNHLLPSFMAAGVALPLQVWSAGCSTGEEPYSVAIASLEAFRGRFLEPVRVLATDIHPEFLEFARKGVYPPSAVKAIPPILLMKYFIMLSDGSVQVKDEVRRLVTFEERNLSGVASAPILSSRYAAIFCRNVMIYFRPSTTRKIVKRFFESLSGGGVLFLGHSETLWGVSDAFRLERWEGAYYYRRPEDGPDGAQAVLPTAPAKVLSAKKVRQQPEPLDSSHGPAVCGKGLSPCLALVLRAEKMADRELFDEAERLCREAIVLNPSCAESFHLLSIVLRRRGKVPEALNIAERALSADNLFVLAAVEIAECLSLLGRNEEASACWEEIYRMLEGEVRFPRLASGAGFSAKGLREYVERRILR